MTHTQLRFRDETRAKKLAGAGVSEDAVRAMLGPREVQRSESISATSEVRHGFA